MPEFRPFALSATYAQTLAEFCVPWQPAAAPAPKPVRLNRELAEELGADPDLLAGPEGLAMFAGNLLPAGAKPVAQAYAGHQFGGFSPRLGDGRALLLGEVIDRQGRRRDIAFKGSGRTPFSRNGDGKCALGPALREFLVGEAMHALGIPTTRALCVTGSPAPVRREEIETAAVVTRLAPSFIRFGHFEHFSHGGRHGELRRLADFVIEHFYPECGAAPGNPYAALLAAVTERSAELVAQWQAVGFCHGVLNTDNMSMLGLTLDYGPFQFLDGFDPAHVCNHSDSGGRYAYARQPNVVYWNLFCLGQAMLPLLDDEQQALAALEPYRELFPAALQRRMNAKLGLDGLRAGDAELSEELLQLMARERTDYTIFWRRLSHAAAELEQASGPAWQAVRDLFLDRDGFDRWSLRWRDRLQEGTLAADAQALGTRMLAANPRLVLRNHLGELAIQSARQGDYSALERLQTALASPCDDNQENEDLADFPPQWASQISISCSS